MTTEAAQAHCRKCSIPLTEENWSEAAWIEWLQHWCQPCLDATATTVTCAGGCETVMTGIPGMDWGVWESFDGTRTDHVCATCQRNAEDKQATDMAAYAPRL